MHKLITCIADDHGIEKAVAGLAEKYNLLCMVNHYARGFGRSASSNSGLLGRQTEKHILHVVVENNMVDEIFEYIFHIADLDKPHGGIIYVTGIGKSQLSPIADTSNIGHSID